MMSFNVYNHIKRLENFWMNFHHSVFDLKKTLFFTILQVILKTTKLLYLSNLTSYQENNDTFLSSTFKVEEIKVSLFS